MTSSVAAPRLPEGRTALVAGGSRGTGGACARELGADGAAGGVVGQIEELGSEAAALQGDVGLRDVNTAAGHVRLRPELAAQAALAVLKAGRAPASLARRSG
ncbi:hypothetical protein [Streptomyces sp. HNM0574]|uniref:hypothetical protein n=1 Tax=Streptomyces sp. HNM0574 TaxID=2714954 RepID=UPI0019D2C14E|nr:hypothetical protein [Streptomyces sp. HNM0574]